MVANPFIRRSLTVTAILLASTFLSVPCTAEEGWNMDKTVKADSVFGFIVEFDKNVQYKVTIRVTAGPNIDVGVFVKDEYIKLKQGEPAVPITGCVVYNVANGTLKCSLEKGSYNLAFDNTDWGEAKPGGQAVTLDFQLVETYIPSDTGGGGEDESDMNTMAIGVIIGIIVAVVVAVVVVIVYLRRNRQPGPQMLAPGQVYQPPQQPPPQFPPPQQPPSQYPPPG